MFCLEYRLDNLGILVRYSAGTRSLLLQNYKMDSWAYPADGYQRLPTSVKSGRGVKLTIRLHL